MSDNPSNLPPSSEDVTQARPRDRHMMRHVVRNMVANMEFVLNDLHGIMGDIQSLVVQIDSVTDKIDEQCGGSKKTSDAGHVVRKPEAIDCESYWSTRRNMGASSNKTTEKDDEERGEYVLNEPPVIQSSPQTTSDQKQEQATRLKNVERWLQQERGIYKHSSLRQPIRKSKDSRNKDLVKRKSSNFEELKMKEIQNQSHLVMQPCPQPKPNQKVTFLPDDFPSDLTENLKTSNSHGNVPCDAKTLDSKGHNTITSNTSDATYLEPIPYCSKNKEIFGKRQIQVFNLNYEENTTADESSLERNQSSPSLFKPSSKSYRHKLSDPSFIPLTHGDQPGLDESFSASLPSSPYIQRRRNINSRYSPRLAKSPGLTMRSQSRLSNTNTYHSLESDLDSVTDPRCLTPDMDWSYLSLVGSDASRFDKSPGHIYQTIGSPVFRRRRFEKHRGPYSFAFQTSPDVVCRLMPLEEAKTCSSASQSDSAENNEAITSLNSSVLYNLEELVHSPVVTHIYCNEVASEGDDYCGFYEAMLDAVLESIAGFDTLEEASSHLEKVTGIVEDTYINFDDEFEEEEWDMSFKQHHDDYFEDDIDLNLLNIPGSQRSDDFSMISADAINISSECDALSAQIKASVCLTHVASKANTLDTTKNTVDSNPTVLNDGALQYDDVDFSLCARKSFVEEDGIAMRTLKEDQDGNFTLWSRPFLQGKASGSGVQNEDLIDDIDNITTSSDEASCQAIGSRSGSSNMSFGSADMAFTSPDDDGLMTSTETDDLYTSQEERQQDSQAGTSPVTPPSVSRADSSKLRQEFFRSLYSACDKQDNENLRSAADSSEEMPNCPDAQTEESASTNLTETALGPEESETGLCLDDLSPFNRRLNTWTAYAMVHVSADDVSDSASDIINDNSITCSMTSSYFEADNNAAGSANQGFVDI